MIARPFDVASRYPRLSRVVLSGLAMAFVGLAAFATAHAIIIAPIWTQLLGGVPFAACAGIALAWAFEMLSESRGSQSIASGVQFGALMFLTLLPATALEAAFRWNGIRVSEWLEIVATVALAVLCGWMAGWRLTRRRDACVAFAVGSVALTFAAAGPLPVAQSVRGAWLSLAIAPICLVAGASLAFVRGHLLSQD